MSPLPADLVYFVRRGEANDELRFSLRTAEANLPHERVWIAGHAPSWVRGVEVLPGNKRSSKWENGPDNLRIACLALLERGIGDLVVMNDDFYVMSPVADLPARRRAGTLAEQVARLHPSPWQASLAQTLKLLRARGHDRPLSYELHAPVAMRTEWLLEAVLIIQADKPRAIPAQWRTTYGNVFRVEAEPAKDRKRLKLRPPSDEPEPAFDSSDDRTFRRVQRPALAELFPEPSRYEGEASRVSALGWRSRTGPRRGRGRPQGTMA